MSNEQWTAPEQVCRWWTALTDDTGYRGYRRGQIARIRRGSTPSQILIEPAAMALVKELPGEEPRQVAWLAGVLVYVTTNDERPIGRIIGEARSEGRTPLVHESRFRRLLENNRSGLLGPMRQMVKMTRGRMNVKEVAWVMLRWSEGVRERLVLDYYGAANTHDQTNNGEKRDD